MSRWVSTWGLAHTELRHFSPGFQDNTMLASVVSQLSGSQMRLRFSNREGKQSYGILAGSVQVNDDAPQALSFGGKPDVQIGPGEEIYANRVSAAVQAGDLITVRLAFSGKVFSGNGIEVATVKASKKGNYVDAPQFTALMRGKTDAYHDTVRPIAALSSIEVLTDDNAKALICFGDSITQQSKWTGPLSEMLLSSSWSVINKGIGGNRLLKDPMFKAMGMYGRRALDRFDRDALDEAGAKAVILALGTNDMGMCRDPHGKGGVTAEMLMAGYKEMADKAHAKGMKVFCATITPRCGCFGWKPSHEQERQKLNRMIRESSLFDGVIDFDQVLRDAAKPEVMDMRLDSGDHLHPGTLGGQRMASLAMEQMQTIL